jgi:hypothetical protein
MDIGSIFLILGLLVIVVLFITRPFFEGKAKVVSREEHEYSALLAERDRILNAIQELDFDYSLGKIPEADYPAQRATLLQRGADTLRQLDAMGPVTSLDDKDARVEAVIAAQRVEAENLQAVPNSGRVKPVVGTPDDDLEVLIANRRRKRSEKAAGFCHQCGRPVQKSDRFCPGCGVTLG